VLRSGLDEPRLNRSVTSRDWVTGILPRHPVEIQGYTVSDRSVRQYVRQKRLQSAEVFVPLSYRPGELAEVDFLTWWSQSRASSGMPGSSSCT
jgi:hypothetical protein